MTQARIPFTVADAITRIAAQLGQAAAGEVVGRAPRTIYDWSDPKKSAAGLTYGEAIALDIAYRADGGEGSPLLEAFSFAVGVEVERKLACHIALADEIGRAGIEFGEATAAAIRIARPGASQRDVHHALHQADEAHGAIGRVVRRLKSFLTPCAGQGAGKTGEES